MKTRIDYTINVRIYTDEDEEVDPKLLEILRRNPEAEQRVENAVAVGCWDFIKVSTTEVE